MQSTLKMQNIYRLKYTFIPTIEIALHHHIYIGSFVFIKKIMFPVK